MASIICQRTRLQVQTLEQKVSSVLHVFDLTMECVDDSVLNLSNACGIQSSAVLKNLVTRQLCAKGLEHVCTARSSVVPTELAETNILFA